jgi:hypothetical protein
VPRFKQVSLSQQAGGKGASHDTGSGPGHFVEPRALAKNCPTGLIYPGRHGWEQKQIMIGRDRDLDGPAVVCIRERSKPRHAGFTQWSLVLPTSRVALPPLFWAVALLLPIHLSSEGGGGDRKQCSRGSTRSLSPASIWPCHREASCSTSFRTWAVTHHRRSEGMHTSESSDWS